jgi:hypothetical protein
MFIKYFLFFLSFSTVEREKEFRIQEVLEEANLYHQKRIRLRKSIVTIFKYVRILKVIEPRFTVRMKTNETKEVEKLTSN